MRSVAYVFSAAHDGHAVDIDRDTVLVTGYSPSGTGFLSKDPAGTVTLFITPVSEMIDHNFVGELNGVVLNVPLNSGDTVYLSVNSAGYYCLIFDDVV